jgi:single-stranded DNA-binding protein
MRSSDDGNPRLLFSTVVDGDRLADEAAPPVRVEYLGDDAEALVPRLLKNTEIYVEGSLRLNTWAGRDGVERTGLYVKATHIEVLGQIGA